MVRAALRELSAPHRTERGDTRLGVVLAAVAGAVNAGGFVAIGAFTSHMSGMLSSMADFVASNRWQAAGLLAGYVAAFFLGSMASAILVNWGRLKRLTSEFALPLMLEALLLLLFGVLAALAAAASGFVAPIALLCLIMGLQNGLITKISHSEIRTTHMTGVVTDLGIEAGRYLFGLAAHTDTRFSPAKARRLALLLLAFVGGGIGGVLAFHAVAFLMVIPLALVLGGLAVVPIAEDLRRMFSTRR